MDNFHEIAAKKGWNKDEQIAVLLDYIDRQSSPEAFNDFLAEQDGYDDGLQSFEIVALWPDNGSWSDDVRAANAEEAQSTAREIMADDYCGGFDDDEDRQAFMAAITIVDCR